MAVDRTKLSFYSGNNYMKRSEFFSSRSISVPSGFAFNTITVNHGLGYIPFFSYAVDYNNDGILWATQWVSSGDWSESTPPPIGVFVDENNLYIRSTQNTNLDASGSRTVHYGIYLDFTT